MSLALSRKPIDENHDLASEVSAAMYERLGRKAAKLEVVARDGLVILRGVLASFYDKQLSLHAAKQVTGVSALRDELQVVSNP